MLVVTSASTFTAMSLICAMASSSRSAGTRTAILPLKLDDLSDDTGPASHAVGDGRDFIH